LSFLRTPVLEHDVAHFGTVEIDNTFYGRYSQSAL